MTEYDLPLLPAKETPWDAKYNPIVMFQSAFLSLRVFIFHLLHLSVPNTNHMMPCDNVSGASISDSTISMIPTQCRTLSLPLCSTHSGPPLLVPPCRPFLSVWIKHNTMRSPQIKPFTAIQCLEAEIGRPDSERKRLDADDDSSVSATPLLSIVDNKGHEVKLDDLGFSGSPAAHSNDGHPGSKSNKSLTEPMQLPLHVVAAGSNHLHINLKRYNYLCSLPYHP